MVAPMQPDLAACAESCAAKHALAHGELIGGQSGPAVIGQAGPTEVELIANVRAVDWPDRLR